MSPALVVVRSLFESRIGPAEELARDKLDAALAQQTGRAVVKVEATLRGRELERRAELRAILNELEERIGPLLDRGTRVRLS